ncbi:MAG: amino acid adenylation domain-containing protein, partial [Verrucomicrobia bacterium]|nr:amino acid adenylation domain-containing protein [Verrucomicrobiota bacterium]
MENKLFKMGAGPVTSYPREASISRVFEAVAAQYPDREAVRFEGSSITYRALNAQANQMARHLQTLGVRQGEYVGISLHRSTDLIIGMLATLKAGAICVPVDTEYPEERKTLMLQETGVKLLWKGEPYPKTYSTQNLDIQTGSTDVANIFFTSGSTGRPKGVETTHRGVVRLVCGADFVPIRPKDRMLHMARISFDATNFEVWGALLNGACVCIYPQQELSIDGLGKFFMDEQITFALLTARLFNLLIQYQISTLKRVRWLASAGEAMSAYHAKLAFQGLPHCHIMNVYGPTENGIATTAYRVRHLKDIQANVPIGRPVPHTQVYVLDAKQKMVPIGAPGELCTGGDGLAQGYLHQKALTREKFIPNPFGPGRLYRTGDLVSFLPEGHLVYLGRIDTQVKIRGFRIEPEEIEHVLREHERISDCIVLARDDVSGD